MKIILLLLFTAFSCNGQTNKINKILIKYVDYDLETFYKIHCADFDNQFNRDVHTKFITDTICINKFSVFLGTLKANKKKYYPDVRAKIIIYRSNGTEDVLCIDGGNSAEFDGNSMLIDTKFVNFIKKIAPSHRKH